MGQRRDDWQIAAQDLPLKEGATPEEVAFNQTLKVVRTVDRGAMLAAFAGFAILVSIAWRKREAEGKNTP
jgi:hypothetical protein